MTHLVAEDRFRILSLDGGGIKGTFTAAVIAGIEDAIGKPLAPHFDLITGTSTGGIIALGLGLGLPGSELLKLYVTHGPRIFGGTGVYSRAAQSFVSWFKPKHSRVELERQLKATFGDRLLGESANRLVIPSYSCTAGKTSLFKTAHNHRFERDYKLPAWQVALATSAAPTYFKAMSFSDGRSFIDGGVWANCPAVVGLLEAIHVLNVAPSSIDVLSIGTTDEASDVDPGRRVGGKLRWSTGIVELLMKAQVDGSLAQAQIIKAREFYRIDAHTRTGRFSLDNVRTIEDLAGLGYEHATNALQIPGMASTFFSRPAEPFVPFHPLHVAA